MGSQLSPSDFPYGVMKAAIVVICATLIGLTMLPLLVSGEPASSPSCSHYAGSVDLILATIRAVESGGNYAAQAAGSSASGAYQFLNSSWNEFDGYHRAADAPAAIQDAKAAALVTTILDRHNGDLGAIPVVWYIGHVPATGSTEWDAVPYPSAGNVLTPRQYQRRWLSKLDELSAALATGDAAVDSASAASECLSGSKT